jgi:serine/threonine protein kinase
VQQEHQFLVYECLDNGSVATFLHDDRGRSRLSSRIRFSIMFQLARSVHFLHTGGCDGIKVFHRDIKSANICLTHNYTAKLIDCGLAKFAPEKGGGSPSESMTHSLLASSGNAAFGTPGYICPRYLSLTYTFESACDVYSIGIVLAELITGCLQCGQSSDGKNFGDFYYRYILDENADKVVDGWKLLKEHSDSTVDWEENSLELACQVAMKCMASNPTSRITILDLVHELSQILDLDFASKNNPGSIPTNPVQQPTESNMDGPKAFERCILCNRAEFDTVQCKDNHGTCIECMEDNILNHHGTIGTGLHCICGCAPFSDDDLYGKVSLKYYNLYIWRKGMGEKVDRLSVSMDHVLSSLNQVKSDLHRALGAMAYIATHKVKECPTLVWMVPADGKFRWITGANPASLVKRRYHVYFICQHTFTPVEPPIEISVTRSWVTRIAPVLKLGLMVLGKALNANGLPFPIPGISLQEQLAINEDFVNSCLDEKTTSLFSGLVNAVGGNAISDTKTKQILPLTGDAYEAIAEQALLNSQWSEFMSPVMSHQFGSLIWVKKECEFFYST